MTEHVVRRGERFEVGIRLIRRGLTDKPRAATAASVRFLTLANADAGGPFPAAFDAEFGGWAAVCPARTEAAGTVLTQVQSVTVAGVEYESRGTLRVIA